MFSATGWSICSSTADNRPGLSNDMVISPDRAKSYKILKRFEFDHSRQCMSVIAEDVQTRKRYIITKGSFEKLAVLCRPDSIPLDFLSQGRQYAMLGGYVLGLGRREMNEGYTPLGDLGVAELSRDSIEMDQSLELLSLLIFRNEAKPESCSAIRHLRQGHVRPVMITGDNAQCGQYIARACAMVDPEAHILLAELSKSTGEVSWSYMSGKGAGRGGEPVIFAEQSFLPSSEDVIRVVETNKLRAEDGSRIELAISGNDTLKALEGQRYFERLLPSVRMFARMSPENKAFVIRKFRDTGFTVITSNACKDWLLISLYEFRSGCVVTVETTAEHCGRPMRELR